MICFSSLRGIHGLLEHHAYIRRVACLQRPLSSVDWRRGIAHTPFISVNQEHLVHYSAVESRKVQESEEHATADLLTQRPLKEDGAGTVKRSVSRNLVRSHQVTFAKPKAPVDSFKSGLRNRSKWRTRGQSPNSRSKVKTLPSHRQVSVATGKTKEQKDEKSNKRAAEPWQIQKAALKEKFSEEGWNPRKRLSPDAMEGIRALHKSAPDTFTTSVLASQFKLSPDAIRRILKSKWQPNEEEAEDRQRRWDKRGEKIWSGLVEKGIRPPKKWREMGIGKAEPGEMPKWKHRKGGGLTVKKSDIYDAGGILEDDDTANSSIGHRIL